VRRRIITTIISGLLFSLSGYVSAQRVPNVFVAGEAALAEEVNENFTAVAGPDTGRIFIAPKGIDVNLQATDRNVPLGVGDSYTAAFGRPSDYVPGTSPDITIRPLFSGCVSENVSIGLTSDFLVIGANGNNAEPRQEIEILMPAVDTTIETRDYARTGLGDVNYVTVDRVLASAPACAVDFNFHGILIEYPR